MRKVLLVCCGLLFVFGNFSRADDDPAVRALIEKAIEANGGEQQLVKFKAVTAKFKGTGHSGKTSVSFTGEFSAQASDQMRLMVKFQDNTLLAVLNRDKAWSKTNNSTLALMPAQLAEQQELGYFRWVASLLPLREKSFTLMPLEADDVASEKEVGVIVTHKGHRPIKFFFDKESLRLMRSESRSKDESKGTESTDEWFFGEFKTIEGVPHPMKIDYKRNGQLSAHYEITEFKSVDKLDDSVFAKP